MGVPVTSPVTPGTEIPSSPLPNDPHTNADGNRVIAGSAAQLLEPFLN